MRQRPVKPRFPVARAAFVVLGLVGVALAAVLAEADRDLPGKGGLRTAEEIAIARENVSRYVWAKAMLKESEQVAAPWVAMSDEELRRMVTPPQVPRSLDVSHAGCPVHGQEIFKHGRYPWIMRLKEPWKLECPVGQEKYPSNDFEAFLRSGLKDRSLLTGPYPDDGWGWQSKEGETKYWFVAHYNQRNRWSQGILRALRALTLAYLLTEDRRYAHTAAVLLLETAGYYPRYDYRSQSRYGTEVDPNYTGKLLDPVSEILTVTTFAQAYDAVYPALLEDRQLHRQTRLTGREIARRIERNILREAARDIMETGKIRGNFGMHQEALLTVALALRETREAPTPEEMVQWVLDGTGEGAALNVKDALYNLIFRDGVPQESPIYNVGWGENLLAVARLLRRTGVDLFREPKFRRLFDWPIDIAVLGRLTPPLGDSGSMFAELIGWRPDLYRAAFREWRDPRYAQIAAWGLSESGARDLFERPVDEEIQRVAAGAREPLGTRSKLFPAYGFATLQHGGRDGVAVTLSFPQYRGHRHLDFLDLGLYAFGKSLIPDFGYPETATYDDPRRWGFFSATVAHNTVVIDAQSQARYSSYRLQAYDVTPRLQRVDVSSPGVYPEKARAYRRCVALVPIDATRAYAVDFFHVAGGRQHDWLVHGSHAALQSDTLKLPQPSPGTLAGPEVPYGFFYDDLQLQHVRGQRSYVRYRGSGYQYLTDPQKVANVPSIYQVEWRWTRDTTPGHLALWCVGDRETAIVCSGKPQNRKELPSIVKYLVRRRQASAEAQRDLESLFASVFEAFPSVPTIKKVERVSVTPARPDALAMQVTLPNRTDLFIFNAGGAELTTSDGTRARGEFVYLSLGRNDTVREAYVAAEGEVRRGAFRLVGSRPSTNAPLRIAVADWRRNVVSLDGPIPQGVAPGQVVMFGQDRHAYEIRGVDRSTRRIDLGDQECVVAGGKVASSEADRRRPGSATPEVDGIAEGRLVSLKTTTTIPHARAGMYLLDENRNAHWRIQKIDRGMLWLSGDAPWPEDARRFWVVDYGPGDTVIFSCPSVFPGNS